MRFYWMSLDRFALMFFAFLTLLPFTENGLELSKASAQTPVQAENNSSEWQEFRSLEGNFRVLMPEIPEEYVSQILHIFRATLQDPEIVFLIHYNLVDIVLADPADPDRRQTQPSPEFLQGFREATIGAGRFIGEQDLQLNGYSVREIEYQDSEGLFHKLRLYYVNSRFYTLEAVSRSHAALASESGRFFDSFRLLQPEQANRFTETIQISAVQFDRFSAAQPQR